MQGFFPKKVISQFTDYKTIKSICSTQRSWGKNRFFLFVKKTRKIVDNILCGAR